MYERLDSPPRTSKSLHRSGISGRGASGNAPSCTSRCHANDQHLLYELAAVLLQISIVLASVAIIARRRFLLYGGGGLSVIGVVVLVIGYAS
jgi:hypothetical protein